MPNSAGVTAMSSGLYHTLAVWNGSVWAWGDNATAGELGNGNFTNKLSPVQVSTADGLPACLAVAVGGGYPFSLALGSNGSVWSWGDDEYGQLGNGHQYANPLSPAHNIPQSVSGVTGAIAISSRMES